MGVIFSIFPMRKGGQGGKGEGNFGRSNLPLNHCAILPSLKLPPSDPRFPRFLPKASYPILYSPGGVSFGEWGCSMGTQEKQWGRRETPHPPCPTPHCRGYSALPRGPRCAGPRRLAAPRTSSRRRRCSMRRCASSALRAHRAAATTARPRMAWACLRSNLSAWTCSVSWGWWCPQDAQAGLEEVGRKEAGEATSRGRAQ